MIEDQFGYRQGDIFLNLTATIDRAHMMAGHIEKIRSQHSHRDTITVSLTRSQIYSLILANEEVVNAVENSISVCDLIKIVAEDNDNMTNIASLCARGLTNVSENEGRELRNFTSYLRASLKE